MRLIVSELCKKEMKKRNSEFDLPVLLHRLSRDCHIRRYPNAKNMI